MATTYWTTGPDNAHQVAVVIDGDGQVIGQDWTEWATLEEAIEAEAIQAYLFIEQRRAVIEAETQGFTVEQRLARLEAIIFGI